MIFDFETAKKIREHYRFLIGENMGETNSVKIDDVVVAPVENKQRIDFLKDYWFSKNNENSLMKSGFNKNEVEVLVIAKGPSLGVYITKCIDKYLTDKNLEKIYP